MPDTLDIDIKARMIDLRDFIAVVRKAAWERSADGTANGPCITTAEHHLKTGLVLMNWAPGNRQIADLTVDVDVFKDIKPDDFDATVNKLKNAADHVTRYWLDTFSADKDRVMNAAGHIDAGILWMREAVHASRTTGGADDG